MIPSEASKQAFPCTSGSVFPTAGLVAALGIVFLLSACTGPLATTGDDENDGEPPEELPEESIDYSLYEDFDVAFYRAKAPDTAVGKDSIQHDVPSDLMDGPSDEAITRTMQGYRIQIFSSKDKAAAVEEQNDVSRWWGAQSAEAPEGLPDQMPAYLIYRQPYYRVRIGNFTTRAVATKALKFVQKRYGDAFISRGEVVVTR